MLLCVHPALTPSACLQEPTITLNFVFIILLLFTIGLITHIPKQFQFWTSYKQKILELFLSSFCALRITMWHFVIRIHHRLPILLSMDIQAPSGYYNPPNAGRKTPVSWTTCASVSWDPNSCAAGSVPLSFDNLLSYLSGLHSASSNIGVLVARHFL